MKSKGILSFFRLLIYSVTILMFFNSCALLSTGEIFRNGDPVMGTITAIRDAQGDRFEQDGPDRKRVKSHRNAFLEKYGYGEQIFVKSFDGAEIATYLYRNDSHLYYVCAHGVLDKIERAIECGSYMFEKGYNFVTYDLRVHGDSTGAYIGCGENDTKDLICVVDFIVEMDPQAIIAVHGKSISGHAVLAACGNGLSDHVKCIICDCGFIKAQDAVEKFAGFMPGFLLSDFDSGVFKATGKHVAEIDASESLRNNRIPIYFIGAGKDKMVPDDEPEKIKSLLDPSVPFKSIVFKDTDHLKPIYFGLDRYLEEIYSFCDLYLTVENSPEKV